MKTPGRKLIAFLLVSSLLLLTPAPSSAWSCNQHWRILIEVFHRMGWKNMRAMNKVVDACLATDLPYVSFTIFGITIDCSWLFPRARPLTPAVVALANTFPDNTDKTNGFHFDDLFSSTEIKTRMTRIEQWMYERIQAEVDAGWGEDQEEEFLILIGLISHAIEDFYCHSNYAGYLRYFTSDWDPNNYPTWDELYTDLGGWEEAHLGFPAPAARFIIALEDSVPQADENTGLRTGAYDKTGPIPNPLHPGETVTPWGHRHPLEDSPMGRVAWELSIRATRQWIEKALNRLPPACRADMDSYLAATDSTGNGPVENPQLRSSLRAGLEAVGAVNSFDSKLDLMVPKRQMACAFADSSGDLVDIQPGAYPAPDRFVVAAPGVIESVLTSPDPAARAILERGLGRLLVARGGSGRGVLAQTTFISGTQGGVNCGSPPCWPGVRGDAGPAPVHDNVNSSLGDSIVVALPSSRRPDGMGINWRLGYDARTGNLDKTNGAFSSILGPPRMVFRLFDPTTKSWSPFDSTELYADNVAIVGSDTVLVGNAFRVDWPPPDKLPSGTLPGGFTINGSSLYGSLAFLPRGSRLQYTFKSVEIDGSIRYGLNIGFPSRPTGTYSFETDGDGGDELARYESSEPRLFTFSVLPGAYSPGTAGTLLAGRTTTPLLLVDPNSLQWRAGGNPLIEAIRGLGVRADIYRVTDAGLRRGNGLGGHELAGAIPAVATNFHPNGEEWSLTDSLAQWYRLVIVDTGGLDNGCIEEPDARLLTQWWNAPTGPNGGDRGLLVAGENVLSALMGVGSPAGPNQLALASDVLGVASASGEWASAASTPIPAIDDRFAATSAGPGLAPPGSLTYPIDGGRGDPSAADGISALGSLGVSASASYPTDGAGISSLLEHDSIADLDQNKALVYAYSLEALGKTGIPMQLGTLTPAGLENRMRLLYKFISSCRGSRLPSQTSQCWPCPTAGGFSMSANWSGATAAAAFQTEAYGPLYPVQDFTTVTGISVPKGGSPPVGNVLAQNSPNPFNPGTLIAYTSGGAGRVQIRIYDVTGRCVRQLLDAVEPRGRHSVRWDGTTDKGGAVGSGVYFFRVTYPDGTQQSKKMTLMR